MLFPKELCLDLRHIEHVACKLVAIHEMAPINDPIKVVKKHWIVIWSRTTVP